MRRSVKVAALASAAALLAIGASMTSFAKGWTQEDGEWVWLDSDGERVTEEFKLSGSKYYWLNEDGVLGSDELVEYKENHYYVDETGAMVTNQWKEVENDEDDDDFEDTIWYYFQSSGKAYNSGKKTINGTTYIFDENGKMLFGWIKAEGESPVSYSMASKEDETDEWESAVYYAGEANDGAVVTNAWRQIRVYDASPSSSTFDVGDNDYWFYFGSNGKKLGWDKEVGEVKAKTINGIKYGFAGYDGHMVSGWTPEAATASDGVKYYSDAEDGRKITKGWFKVVPSEAIDPDNYEGANNEAKWFYAKNDGTLEANGIRTVNGKKYLFNQDGELCTGLYWIALKNDRKTLVDDFELDEIDSEADLDKYTEYGTEYVSNSTSGVYYFATPTDTDAAMKTGTCTVTVDGESYAFKFETSGTIKGQGVNGPDGNNYYINGRKLKADSDNKFEIYQANIVNGKVKNLYGEVMTANEIITDGKVDAEDGANGFAVISSTGSIVKSGTKKDGDDYKITVSGSAITKFKDSDDNEWTVDGLEVTYKKATK